MKIIFFIETHEIIFLIKKCINYINISCIESQRSFDEFIIYIIIFINYMNTIHNSLQDLEVCEVQYFSGPSQALLKK